MHRNQRQHPPPRQDYGGDRPSATTSARGNLEYSSAPSTPRFPNRCWPISSFEIDGPNRIRGIYPKNLPDLFKGDQMTSSAATNQAAKGRSLSRNNPRQKKTFECGAVFPKRRKETFHPPHLGNPQSGLSFDEIRLRGEKKELKEEVARLARKYGIVTPYTPIL